MPSQVKTVVNVIAVLVLLSGAFIAGAVTMAQVRRNAERTILVDDARKLLDTATALRAGEVEDALRQIDEWAAAAVLKTARGIPDDKRAAPAEGVLWLWQTAKAYYEQHDPAGPMASAARAKLQSVPWSPFQQAKRAFAEKYGQGKLAIAPAFAMRHWFGPALSEQDTKGKVVLLDFWHVHCTPRVKSLPALRRLHDTYKNQGLVVIGCAGGETAQTARFLRQHPYTFPIGMGTAQTWLNYAIEANPTYFLIDWAGRLVWGPEHQVPTDEQVSALLAPATQVED